MPTWFVYDSFTKYFIGCNVVSLGLQEGCSFACNETLKERPKCLIGCLRGSQQLKVWLIDFLGNVEPPQPLSNKVQDYSMELVFSKYYLEKLQKQHPTLDISKSIKI